jgi:hypothetical protein
VDARDDFRRTAMLDDREFLEVPNLQVHVFFRQQPELLRTGHFCLTSEPFDALLGAAGDEQPIGDVVILDAVVDRSDAAAARVPADDDIRDL